MPLPEKFLTKDNSYTLKVPGQEVFYHSIHGAKTESSHIFIEKGLKYKIERMEAGNLNRSLHILELGFGTGLNAILTADYLKQNQAKLFNVQIHYQALDILPIRTNLTEISSDLSDLVIDCSWNKKHNILPYFTLHKHQQDWLQWNTENCFDLIYLDFFAPEYSPDLWNEFSLKKMWNSLSSNGIMTTFCAKGSFKRQLKALGFQIEALPGPPGKREMIRAIKPLVSNQKL